MDDNENKAFADQEHNIYSSQDNVIFVNDTQPFPDEEVKRIEHSILKKKFNKWKTYRKFVYFTLSMMLYSVTHIFLRYNTMGVDHFLLPYFQVASLVVFIPFSFLKTNITENCSKGKPTEIERSSSVIEEKMKDEFSEIMEKKFYENYFEYSSRFYLHAIILSLLYYIRLLFYYWSLYYIPPLNCNSIFASTVIVLQVIRMLTGKYKPSLLSNFILIFYSCGLCCLFGYLNNANELKSLSVLGVIYASISVIVTALFLYYYNSITKKYKYYIDIFELFGFIGLFCLVIIPFPLVLMSYFATDGVRIPMGIELFIVLGKAMLCSCVNDVLIFNCISMFSMSVEVTSLGSFIIFLYVFHMLLNDQVIADSIKITYFGCGVGLIMVSFILSMLKFLKIELGKGSKKDKHRAFSEQSYRSKR